MPSAGVGEVDWSHGNLDVIKQFEEQSKWQQGEDSDEDIFKGLSPS